MVMPVRDINGIHTITKMAITNECTRDRVIGSCTHPACLALVHGGKANSGGLGKGFR
jgi:hypothetical protein